MFKSFTEWLQLREMGGASGAPGVPGGDQGGKHPDFNFWGADPSGQPYPQHMKKKSKKLMKKI